MERATIRLVGVVTIFLFLSLFLSLFFTLNAFGKHFNDVRIPNNGIVSFYDFEGSQNGDPIFPDKVGKTMGDEIKK